MIGSISSTLNFYFKMFTYQRNFFLLVLMKNISEEKDPFWSRCLHTQKNIFPEKILLVKNMVRRRTNERTSNLSFVSNLFANKLYYINFNFIFLKRKKKLRKLAFSLRDFVLLLKSRKKCSNKNLAFFIVNKVSPIKNHVCFTLKCSSKSLL